MQAVEAITPFTIAIPDCEIAELKARLIAARWPVLTEDSDWRDGVGLADAQHLCQYWLEDFDWRRQEASLNRWPHFTTTIESENVHFIHLRSFRPDATPLILFHGWPSTFAEYRHVVDQLANPENPDDPAFHIVLPSLLGFGFSGPLHSPGWSLSRMADAFTALMQRLGYAKFMAHGGDAGHFLASALARQHPDSLIGLHLSLGGLQWPALHRNDEDLTDDERKAITRADQYWASKAGYAQLQMTRPHAPAYGLTDSPIGQMTWIAEKFREWADLSHPIAVDDLLTTVAIYWFTRTAGSAARIYKDSIPRGKPAFVNVPTGIAAWPHEITKPSRRWVEADFAVAHWRDMPEGGHFPALEVPKLLIENIRRFASLLQPH